MGRPKWWTEDRIIAAIQAWPGGPPTRLEWETAGDGHPSKGAVVETFGSWNAGIRAAGFEPRIRGGQPRPDGPARWWRARLTDDEIRGFGAAVDSLSVDDTDRELVAFRARRAVRAILPGGTAASRSSWT